MCTLIVFSRMFTDASLLVAANRDERLDRPAAGPSIIEHRGMRILCPRDLEGHGTWLGINEERVFVGITNRFGVDRNAALRSRGLLVLDALSYASAKDAAEAVSALDPRAENAFHLVMADPREAHLVWSDGATFTHRALDPGAHVVTERSFGAAPTAREIAIRERLAAFARRSIAPSDSDLTALMSSHAEAGFEGVCVHVPGLSYGTRSSTIIRLADRAHVLHAEGPPCTTPYAPVPTDPLFSAS
jgi:uncharacterized protein with NRDE domain